LRLGEIITVLEDACPPGLAAEWDNVGLHVGDAGSEVKRIVVALDPDAQALERATGEGADLLVTHHPLFRQPPRRFTPTDPDAARVMAAVRGGLAVYSMHTNFDSITGGVSDALAERLGLEASRDALVPEGAKKKIVVFVPPDSVDKVAGAMASAGAGRIGDYSECSFRVAGTGTFRAPAYAHPAQGKAGEFNEVQEVRLEMVLPSERADGVARALLSAHPYEEVAYDVYDVAGTRSEVGLGRIGRLKPPQALSDFAVYCSDRLETPTVKYAGPSDKRVSVVAVCGGSGGGLLEAARRAGADVLVTGDIRYHDAQKALQVGLAVVDAGHDGTEAPSVQALAALITGSLQAAGYDGDLAVYWRADPIFKPAGG